MSINLRSNNLLLCLALVVASPFTFAQQSAMSADDSASVASRADSDAQRPIVPRLVKYSGVLRDSNGDPRTGIVGINFSIYSTQQGGTTLWMETQNVRLDSQGRFNVLLGAGRKEGLPSDIFVSNDAHWLGVQVLAESEAEQPRVLLVSVPYALKAQDAETLGGRPATAYLLSDSLREMLADAQLSDRMAGSRAAFAPEVSGAVSTATPGTSGTIPKFDVVADTLVDSIITEKLVGAELRVGIGTGAANPGAKLEINGRLKAEGFDVTSSAHDSVHIVNTAADGLAMQLTSSGPGFAIGLLAGASSTNGIGLAGVSKPVLIPQVPGDYNYGLIGFNFNHQGAGLFGVSTYTGGAASGVPPPIGADIPVGVYGSVAHSSGIAGIFDDRAATGGQIFSGRVNGTEVVSMNRAGDIIAAGTITSAGAPLPTTSYVDAGDATEAAARAAAVTAESTARAAGDAATLASANTYADTQVATEVTARASADTTEATARATGDAATLTSANTYTDTQVAAEATARAAGDAATLTSANTYTDTQVAAEATARATGDAATLASANTYADTQVATEASARAAADTTETAARIAADALNAKLAGNNVFTGSNDFSGATATAPVRALTGALPGTCVANVEMVLKTDAAIGQQLYSCNSTGDGWNLVSDPATTTLASANTYTDTQVATEASARASAVTAEATTRAADDATEAAARIAGDATNATAITTEATIRASADTTETSARIAGDAANATAITTEATARAAGDATNATAITTEATARAAADTTNATAISTETTNRIAGDAASLSSANTYTDTSVATEATARAAADTTNATAITTEATARASADTTETAARIAGDATNATAVTNEAAARAAGDATNASAISTEATTRAADDATEAAARIAGDATNTTAVTSEATARAAGDTTNASAISTEATTRASADTTNATAISTETTNRIAADALNAKLAGGNTFTGGTQTLAPGTATAASLNMASGVAPTTPVIGDVWNESGSLKVRFDGSTTKTLAYTDSGSSITNLDAGNITTGTLSDSRLSANVALLSGTQTFTGSKNFSSAITGDLTGNVTGNVTGSSGSTTGNAATATALATGRTISITGDLAYTSPTFNGSTNVTAAGTLATVATAGTTGSSTAIPVITINAKGLTTGITTAAVVAPAGTLSGTTLAAGVTASSLTGVGTITSGTWNGTTIAVANGGTGVTSSGSAGNYLRSNGTSWASSTIQLSDLPSLSGNFVDLTTNQSIAGTKTFTGTVTASGAASTMPIKVSSTLPATCVAEAEMLIKTGPITGGQQVYLCAASGTGWNLIGDGLGNNNNLSFNPVTIAANLVNLVKNTCTTAYTGVYPAFVAGKDIPIPPATGSLSGTSTLVASVLSSTANSMPAAWDSYTFLAYVDSSGTKSFLHVCNLTLTSFAASGSITFNVRAIN